MGVWLPWCFSVMCLIGGERLNIAENCCKVVLIGIDYVLNIYVIQCMIVQLRYIFLLIL